MLSPGAGVGASTNCGLMACSQAAFEMCELVLMRSVPSQKWASDREEGVRQFTSASLLWST
eukprot:5258525-Amphidinium_carterae.1